MFPGERISVGFGGASPLGIQATPLNFDGTYLSTALIIPPL